MLDIIKTRRSVREFSPKAINKDDLLQLVEAGFMAPTARAQQSAAFVIIDDKKIIADLVTVSPGARVLANAQAVIAVFCPDVNKLLTKEMVMEDLGAVTENILLAATSLKIGSCWIGIAPIAERMVKAEKILNLPKGAFIFSLVALGYPLNPEKAFYVKDKVKPELIYWNQVK